MPERIPLGDAMRDAFPELVAPDELHAWARTLATEGPPETRAGQRLSPWTRRLLYAAGLVVACALGWTAHGRIGGSMPGNTSRVASADAVASELVDDHVRSLMGDHLLDVRSTDQHTVKPWFAGRADFAPRVLDLASIGFPLLGGRLDYAQGHTAAALVFGRRRHVINLYEWPASGPADTTEAPRSVRGYSVLHWVIDGLAYWAVTDASPADLVELRRAYLTGG